MTKKLAASRHNPFSALAGSAFSRLANADPADGNHVKLLRDGAENYPAWLNAIAGAQHHVHLENYILEEDQVGQSFADTLLAAAGRGVRCSVLYDWLGCRTRTSKGFWTKLRAAGIDVRCYNPPRLNSPLGWISRDHRKLICVDGVVAYTGGLCIGHDWAGDPARHIPAWRDTGVEVRGPAVRLLELAFADSWLKAGSALPPDEIPAEDPPKAGDLGLWVIGGYPESMGLYRLEQLVADIAERSLWLADAYFVATTGYVRSLAAAARAGVDVRLLVPGSSNFPVVRALSRAGYHALLEAGVRVFEWDGPMMHAKTAVADGCWARVGSSNSNLASWISNRELDVTVYDAGFANEMEAMYERDLETATEIVLDAGRVRSSAHSSPEYRSRKTKNASRLLAGAVGFGSVVGATLTRHRALGPAEFRVLATAGGVMIPFVLVAFFMPRLIAYPFGAMVAWIAVALLVRAWKLRIGSHENR